MLFHGMAKLIELRMKFLLNIFRQIVPWCLYYNRKSLLAVDVQITIYDGLVLLENSPSLGERRIKSN